MKTVFLAVIILMGLQLVVGPGRKSMTDLIPITDVPKLTPPITHFLKQIPNLFGLCTAIKGIPHRIVLKMKEFLESIVPQLPEGNLIRFHFTNVIFLINSYKSIIDQKKKIWKDFTDVVENLEEPEPVMFRSLDDINEEVNDVLSDLPKPFDFIDSLINPFDSFPESTTPRRKPQKRKIRKSEDDIPKRKLDRGSY